MDTFRWEPCITVSSCLILCKYSFDHYHADYYDCECVINQSINQQFVNVSKVKQLRVKPSTNWGHLKVKI